MSVPVENFDIVILGAGPVGSTLALLLADTQQRVLLVERRALAAGRDDPRALALAAGTRQLLAPLNAWPDGQAADLTPIETIHISQSGGFGRALIDRQDYRLPALGYVVRYGALLASLHDALAGHRARRSGQITCLENTEAQVFNDVGEAPAPGAAEATEHRRLQLSDANGTRQIRTRLVVHADGTPPDDKQNGISRRYGQRALIFEASLQQPHRQRAWERFTPNGPLALLPIGGAGSNRVSVVYTVPESDADALLALDDATLQKRLQQAIGPQLRFSDLGPRSSFPLQLRLRKPLATQRELWIGNAAQTLHPVSGQGFNLGLRDAARLGQLLRDPAQPDPGNAALLGHYSRHRQLDRYGTAAFTDGIVRVFSTPAPLLNVLRGIGLTALDLIGPLRHGVARRMIWGARAWP